MPYSGRGLVARACNCRAVKLQDWDIVSDSPAVIDNRVDNYDLPMKYNNVSLNASAIFGFVLMVSRWLESLLTSYDVHT